MDFFHKRGGVRGNPKVLGHFLCTNNFGILGRKGGGVDQIQKFLGTISLIFGEIWHKKCPKSLGKKLAYGKVSQKFQKSGGGVRPFWKKSIIKLHFVLRSSLTWTGWPMSLPCCSSSDCHLRKSPHGFWAKIKTLGTTGLAASYLQYSWWCWAYCSRRGWSPRSPCPWSCPRAATPAWPCAHGRRPGGQQLGGQELGGQQLGGKELGGQE